MARLHRRLIDWEAVDADQVSRLADWQTEYRVSTTALGHPHKLDMKQVSTTLTRSEAKELERAAFEMGIDVSRLIRGMLRGYLERRRNDDDECDKSRQA